MLRWEGGGRGRKRGLGNLWWVIFPNRGEVAILLGHFMLWKPWWAPDRWAIWLFCWLHLTLPLKHSLIEAQIISWYTNFMAYHRVCTKWASANFQGSLTKCCGGREGGRRGGWITCGGLPSHNELLTDEPFGSVADFTWHYISSTVS